MFYVLGFRFYVSLPDGWAEVRAGIGVSALRARRRGRSSIARYMFYNAQIPALALTLSERASS
jgi:hypothetical protein